MNLTEKPTGNIYLTGFMGAGKSTLGRALAEKLNRPFFDMDQEVEKKAGQSVAEIFSCLGEPAFRKLEAEQLARLAKRRGLVVACGGGLATSPQNRALMRKTGLICLLSLDLKTCLERLSPAEKAARPMLGNPTESEKLLSGRSAAYRDNHISLDVRNLNQDQALAGLMALLLPPVGLKVSLGRANHPALITLEGPGAAAKMLNGHRTVILTDRKVAALHLERYLAALEPVTRVETIVIPGGERAKSLASAKRIFQQLLDLRLERSDFLLALGGGVITDLGAFVAATFKRGMNFIPASTSLLGCVDAALGGKAAVNLGAVKNIVGAFTVPHGVILDVAALASLAPAQIREGLIEAYKTGLLGAPDLARFIQNHHRLLLSRDIPSLWKTVEVSARTKRDVVAEDFTESGRRAILNLGHTYGHVLETWHRFKLSHGRAVAVGLKVAGLLSLNRGLIAEDFYQNISQTVEAVFPGLPALPPVAEAWHLAGHDKKNRGGKIVYILLESLGRTRIVDDITRQELGQALARLEKGEG